MTFDDVIEIRVPAPDSQYRLCSCGCGDDHVAYEKYQDGKDEKWRVRCFKCMRTVDKGCLIRHDAQIAWNKEMKHDQKRA